MNRRHWWIATMIVFLFLLAAVICFRGRFPERGVLLQKLRGQATVSDRIAQFGPSARARWLPYFEKKHISYPPYKVLLVGLKREKQIQVYAAGSGQSFRFIRSFPIQGMSGKLGPKLHLGDYQVPEGFYNLESLNPNSAFHVALRVNYPNTFDRSQAQSEAELGGNIMIHGSNVSTGCLAMGDEAAEDLFTLTAEVGLENTRLILSPVDFRVTDVPDDSNRPAWVSGLYRELRTALLRLPIQ